MAKEAATVHENAQKVSQQANALVSLVNLKPFLLGFLAGQSVVDDFQCSNTLTLSVEYGFTFLELSAAFYIPSNFFQATIAQTKFIEHVSDVNM